MYQPRRLSRSEFIPLRNLRYHVRVWGEPAAGRAPLVLVHGWMDVAASWQFVVDAFAAERWVIAPDWRGYGDTETPDTDTFWFPDYLADLDFLLDHFSPGAPVDLAGHSMGGNVAMLYAGARPGRIRRLVNLEGFGLPPFDAREAPGRHAQWMDDLKAFHGGTLGLTTYDGVEAVVGRLMKTNPRLARDKAGWLARQWARPGPDGRWRILGHPAHKVINPVLFRVEEVLAAYRAIRAPVLSLEARADSLAKWGQGRYTKADYHKRLQEVSDARVAVVDDAGHMLHHDQPVQTARLIEEFLAAG